MSKLATIPRWATDTLFPAGGDAWSAQPNKEDPSDAKKDVGRVPAELPPATETNWWRNMVSRWLLHLCTLRVLNWLDIRDYTAVAATGAPAVGCWDEGAGYFYLGTANGEVIQSPTGEYWDDDGGGAAVGPFIGNPIHSIDSSDADHRVATGNHAADAVYYKTTAIGWTVCTLGGAGLTWEHVASDHDANGGGAVWLIVDNATPAVFYRSTDGITFTVVNVTGFTGSGVNTMLVPSRDPDNDTWLVIDGTNASRSADQGATWTTAAHGLTLKTPSATYPGYGVCYDRASGRYIAVLSGGSAGDVAYSEDNGATWSTFSSVLPSTVASPSDLEVFTSGDGEIIAHIGDVGFWSSVDGGETWRPVDLPAAASGGTGTAGARFTFGRGRFVSIGGTAAAAPDLHLSLRAES